MSTSGRIILLLFFILLMGVIYAVGAYVMPDLSTPAVTPPGPTPVYIPEQPDPVYTELGSPYLIEYGEPYAFINNNDPFHAYVRFPQAGNPTDTDIFLWAQRLFDEMAAGYTTGAEFTLSEFGELNIHFDSYLIDNRYAGVHLHGQYSYNTTDIPQEINKTFNIDLTQFSLMQPEDILDFEDPENLLQLLSLRLLVEHPNTDGYHIYLDESWLKYLLITHEGIVVFLPHAEFLPDSFDSLTVTLPYEDLGASLLIRKEAPLPEMPVPTPEPTPEPPSPTPNPDGSDPDGGNPDGSDHENGDTEGGDPESGNSEGDDAENGNPEAGDTEGGEPDVSDSENVDPESGDPEGEQDPYANLQPQSGPIDPDRPVIAFSFEDGPGIHTDELLDLFEQYGVRATFCVVGNIVHTRQEALVRSVELGCEVIGQSWNHKNMAKMTPDDVRLQLESTQSAIEEITGVNVPLFRPPYGAVSDTMKDVAEELGFSMVKWNVDPEDWKYQDADYVYDRIIEQVSDRAIIMSHELYGTTIEAYRHIIPELLLQGYQIVTVSELLNLTYNELTPGFVYYSGVYTEILT